MTEKQIKIADRLLGILVEHDGRGLAAGEQIVTEGFHKLTPGMKVRAQAAVPKKEEEQTSDSLNKQVVSETKPTAPAENKSKDNNPSK